MNLGNTSKAVQEGEDLQQQRYREESLKSSLIGFQSEYNEDQALAELQNVKSGECTTSPVSSGNNKAGFVGSITVWFVSSGNNKDGFIGSGYITVRFVSSGHITIGSVGSSRITTDFILSVRITADFVLSDRITIDFVLSGRIIADFISSDSEENRKRLKVKVRDVLNLSGEERIVLEFDYLDEPFGEAQGLLAGFCGILATDFSLFPILFEKWSDLPISYFDHVFDLSVKQRFCLRQSSQLHEVMFIILFGKSGARIG
nr:uncharacterized protein LOC104110009 [Nicotiana tomentosiformis]